jgi:hypothetical protein
MLSCTVNLRVVEFKERKKYGTSLRYDKKYNIVRVKLIYFFYKYLIEELKIHFFYPKKERVNMVCKGFISNLNTLERIYM